MERRGGRHPDDCGVEPGYTHRPVEGSIAEGEDSSVGPGSPPARSVACAPIRNRHHWSIGRLTPSTRPAASREAEDTDAATAGRQHVVRVVREGSNPDHRSRPRRASSSGAAGEDGVPEGEDAPIGGSKPVAAAIHSWSQCDDWCIEGLTLHAVIPDCPAKRMHGTIGGHQPEPTYGGIRRNTDDRAGCCCASQGPIERGVTNGEDAAVGGGEPVASTVPGRGNSDYRRVQLAPGHRAEEPGIATQLQCVRCCYRVGACRRCLTGRDRPRPWSQPQEDDKCDEHSYSRTHGHAPLLKGFRHHPERWTSATAEQKVTHC